MAAIAAVTPDAVAVPLLEVEGSPACMALCGITTVSFFSGCSAEEAVAALRPRVREVLEANPWLAGRLARGQGRGPGGGVPLQLVHPPADQVDDATVDSLFSGTEGSIERVHARMGYVDLCRAIGPGGLSAVVDKGTALIDDPRRLVTKITVTKDITRPKQAFALVFSVAHVAADACTYYRVLSMLSAHGSRCGVEALSAARRPEVGRECAAAQDEEERAFRRSAGIACNAVCTSLRASLRRRSPRCAAFVVGRERVENEKRHHKLLGKTEFVSTNDILTSHFGRSVDARVLYMGINWRNRVAGCCEGDAGNYHAVLPLDPETYVSPAAVRHALTPPPAGAGPRQRWVRRTAVGAPGAMALPGCWESLTCRQAVISNWATLYDGCFSLPTLPEVFLELHVPYYPLADICMDRAIVFRPRPNEVAVLYLLAKADDGLLQELVHGQGSPLSGGVVCEHMFGASPPRPPPPSPPQTGNGDEVDAGPEEFSALDESGSEQ
jgi:hypothetical protein